MLIGIGWPLATGHGMSPHWADPLFPLAWHLLLFALLKQRMSRRGLSLSTLTGDPPRGPALRWAIRGGLALAVLSLATFFAIFVPLSHVAPTLVQSWVVDNQAPLVYVRGSLYPLANLVSLFGLVWVGPFVEELFFRGLLLRAWSRSLGDRGAVVAAAVLFGVLHFDIVGGFVFAVLTSIVFLRTGRLWLTVAIHAAHNAVVWGLAAVDVLMLGDSYRTLADLQRLWWVGPAGLLASVPALVAVYRRIPGPSE